MKLQTLLVVAAASFASAPSALATNLYVSNSNSNSISPFSISVSANGKLTPIPCPANHCQTGSAPGEVAMTPDGKLLYTSNAQSNTVSAFKVAANGALTPIPCSTCHTGSEPYWMAITPDGRFLYASNYDGGISPFKINASGTLTPIPCPGSHCQTSGRPEQPAISPNGKFLYVATEEASKVAIFSIQSNGSLIPVTCTGSNCDTGNYPYADAITPNGKFLYVVNYESDSLSAFSIHANGNLSPVTCTTACSTGGYPEAVAITPDGKYLYVTDSSDEKLSYYTIHGDGTLGPLICTGSDCATGSGPSGVTMAMVNRDYPFLYVANENSDTVSPFYLGPGGSLGPIACPACTTGSAPYTGPIVASPDQAPTASFKTSLESTRYRISFNAAGSKAAPGDTVQTFNWTFGDGTTGFTEVPTTAVTHTYSKPGTYRVTLTVADLAGCSDVQIFTGQSMYCNGGAQARLMRNIVVKAPANASATTAPATSVGVTTVTLHGSIVAHGAKVRWHFHYAKTNGTGKDTSVQTIAKGKSQRISVTVKVSGLDPHAKYHFSLVADAASTPTRLAGQSEGATLSFTTT